MAGLAFRGRGGDLGGMLIRLFALAVIASIPLSGYVVLTGLRTIFETGPMVLFLLCGAGLAFTLLGAAFLSDRNQRR